MIPAITWLPDTSGGPPYTKNLPIGIMARPRGGDWFDDEFRDLKRAGVDVLVSILTPEEERELQLQDEASLCEQHDIIFVKFPIPDRGVPPMNQQTFDLFHRLNELVDEGKTLVYHCRMGIGQSSLVAVSLATMRGSVVETSLLRLEQVQGKVYPDADEQRQWMV